MMHPLDVARQLELVVEENPQYFGDSTITDAVAAVLYRLRHLAADVDK